MIVVGGTYREVCVRPEWDYLAGSGVRAAGALANAPERPTLHTAVDEDAWEEADLVAGALGIAREVTRRTEGVGFRYFTPISSPSVNGPASELEGLIVADADTALVFGMVERGSAKTAVTAKTLVLDPQRPRDGGPFNKAALSADRFVIVANQSEVARLGGPEGPAAILSKGVQAVVTKRAAAGCVVTWVRDGETMTQDVGAHATSTVWPIGSGDVFSAGLAHALDRGADYVEAARVGSACAAHWCSTQAPAVPADVLAGDTSTLPPTVGPGLPAIYLAGPFFSLGELWLVEQLRETLAALGAVPWSPLHEVGQGGVEVAQKDIDGLDRCDAVLALLDGRDVGTVFEVGFAVSRGIPVVGYAANLPTEDAKMMEGLGVELHHDLATACYRSAWVGMGAAPLTGWQT